MAQIVVLSILAALIVAYAIWRSPAGRAFRIRVFFNGDEDAMLKDEWRQS
jgi:hypothetical protein